MFRCAPLHPAAPLSRQASRQAAGSRSSRSSGLATGPTNAGHATAAAHEQLQACTTPPRAHLAGEDAAADADVAGEGALVVNVVACRHRHTAAAGQRHTSAHPATLLLLHTSHTAQGMPRSIAGWLAGQQQPTGTLRQLPEPPAAIRQCCRRAAAACRNTFVPLLVLAYSCRQCCCC